jgi:hypothetical protein
MADEPIWPSTTQVADGEPFVVWRAGEGNLELAKRLGAPPHCRSIELAAKFGEAPRITFVCYTTKSQWVAIAEHFKRFA